jgi:hypothetical protein
MYTAQYDTSQPLYDIVYLQLIDFWPEKGESVEVDCGNFKLSMRDDPEENPGYIVREFILESIQVSHVENLK